nr:MAG TPA: hypothetical protein [Caudoviricetes sp.]
MTNREWLQTLTDEEFAKWNFDISCGMCANNPATGICKNISYMANFDENRCIDGIARWLKQKHKEN